MGRASRDPRHAVIGRRELRRRQERLKSTVGSQLAELREEFNVSLRSLAGAAGLDPAHVSRIERGIAAASLDALVAIGASLGADLSVRFFPTSSPRIRDHLQAPMVEAVVRSLDPRWRPDPELPVPTARGSIDLALRLRTGDLRIACEAHSELRSIERVQRRLFEKATALGELGEPRVAASSLLLVRSTAANRDVVRRYRATLEAAFPGSVAAAIEALTSPTAPWPGPTLVWVRLEAGRADLLPSPPRGIAVGRG